MGTDLAKAGNTALGQVLDYGDQAGAGFDNQTSDDVSIPFLGVLQPMSPEVGGEPSKRIKGASAGQLINTVTKELFDGDEGVIFQPADTRHVFVEWKPRNQGGGFVAEYRYDDPKVLAIKAAQEFGKYKTEDGNDLIETYYVTGLLHRSLDLDEQAGLSPEPMVIAFTSTKIRVYKAIMTRLNTVKGKPPLYAHRLKITSRTETNSDGTFSNFIIKAAVEDNVIKSLIPPRLASGEVHPVLSTGQALLNANRSGEVKESRATEATAAAPGGGGAKKDADIPF